MKANRDQAWLTTFGDMLTLLLCFFICTISLGPYGFKELPKSEENQLANTGTDIAATNPDSLVRLVEIDEHSYQTASDEVLPDLLERLETQIDPEVYSIKNIRVETCFGQQNLYEGQSWHVSMTRALALRSQLLDSQRVLGAVSLRSLGPWCEVLGGYEREQQIAARLRIELEEINHG